MTGSMTGYVKVVIAVLLVLVVAALVITGAVTGWTWSFRRFSDPEGLNRDLLRASSERDLHATRKLLRMGADPNVQKEVAPGGSPRDEYERGWRPLHFAMEFGETEIGEALLDYGADPNACNAAGETPLHLAAGYPRPGPIDLLLSHGAHVNARSPYDVTPLHYAVHYGYHQAIERIIGAGAEVNAATKCGATPLHTAAGPYLRTSPSYAHPSGVSEQRAMRIAKTLLDHDADVNAANNEGWTAVDVAWFFGRERLVGLLRCNGAKTGKEMDEEVKRQKPEGKTQN